MPACDAQSLMDLAASRGYGKLSHRQLAECWLVAAANSAPSTAFAYTPATSIITWTDMNGIGQQGDLAFFNATADKPSVTVIDFTALAQLLLTVTNIQDLTALQRFIGDGFSLTSLDFHGMTTLQVIAVENNLLTSLNVTGCTGATELHCENNQLPSITGLSTCTALTTFLASNNLFTTFNLNFMPAHIDALDVSNNPNLTSFTANSVTQTTGHIIASFCANLATFSMTGLVTCGGDLDINNTAIVHVSFPALVNGPPDPFSLHAQSNAAMLTFSAPGMTNNGGVLQLDNNSGLTTVTLTSLVSSGDFICQSCPSLTSISLPVYISANSFDIHGDFALTALSIPTAGFVCSGAFDAHDCTSMVTANFGGGAMFNANVDFTGNTAMASLSVPGMTCGINGPFVCESCSSLTTLALGSAIFADSGELIDFIGCALTVGDATHGIDGILNRGVFSGVSSLDFELSGGTNSTPSPAGQADKAMLIAAGNTVNTN